MPRLARIPAFAAVLLLLIGGLRLLNWLPHQLERTTFRDWRSLQEAQRRLELPALRPPSFFPDTLRFPAQEVWAGTHPEPVVLLHFGLADRDRLGLAILWATRDATPPPPRLLPTRIFEERTVELEEHTARLELAACADGRPCNRLRWHEDPWEITLVGSLAEEQLLRIGHSMVTR